MTAPVREGTVTGHHGGEEPACREALKGNQASQVAEMTSSVLKHSSHTERSYILKDLNIQLRRDVNLILGNSSKIWASTFLISAYT